MRKNPFLFGVYLLSQAALLLLGGALVAFQAGWSRFAEPSFLLHGYVLLFPFFGIVLPATQLLGGKGAFLTASEERERRWLQALWAVNLFVLWISYVLSFVKGRSA